MDTTPSLGANLLRRRPQSRARKWLVIASLVGHVAAIGAYIFVGMLRVERLTPDRGHISVAIGMKIPDAGPGPAAGRKPDEVKPKPKDKVVKHQVEAIVQPTTDTTKISTEGQQATNTSTTGTGSTTGGGGGGKPCIGADCDKPPCTGLDCGETPTTNVKHEDPPPKPHVELPPNAFKALRLTPDAETKIQPSNVTKTAMVHDGIAKTMGIIRVCIDTSGRVESASLKKSTGYPAYDALLISGVRSWDYKAAVGVDGKPTPACSQVFFNFLMQ